MNTEVFGYTLRNGDSRTIKIGARPESFLIMFNRNTSFIKKLLSRNGDDIKKLNSDLDCKICTEDNYCGICRNKLFYS